MYATRMRWKQTLRVRYRNRTVPPIGESSYPQAFMPRGPLRYSISVAFLALLAVACAVRRPAHPDREREAPPGQWFMIQRLGGDGRVPLRALSRALEATREKAASDAPGSWTGIGPVNIGGRVTALALAPNDGNHIWLGAAAGGVFTSTNGGTAWTARFDDQAPMSIGSIAAHPTDSLTAWV